MSGPKPLTLIVSDSEFLAALELDRVRAQWERKGFAVEEISAEDPQAVAYALDTMSLLGEGRFVVVRGQASQLQQIADHLVAWADSPPHGIAVAVVAQSADKLRKALGARAEIVDVSAPKPWEVADWVVRHLKGKGRVMQRDAAAALVDAIGTELRDLANAAEQLATATSGPIGVDAVTRLFRGFETQVYTFLDAVVQRDRPGALRHLNGLMRAGQHPLAIHAALINQFRVLTLAREAGRTPAAAVAREAGVSIGHANRAMRAARAWDAADVRRAFRLLADADFALKGGERGEEQPPELVMETLVSDIVGEGRALPRAPHRSQQRGTAARTKR